MAETETPAADIGQLTSAQQEALQMYTSVTDQDITDAISMLTRSEWNVQIAITKFFDGETADPLEAARQEAAAVPAQGRTSGVLVDDLGPASIRYRGSRAMGGLARGGATGGRGPGQGGWRPPFLLAILFSPFTLIYGILSSGYELLLDLWRGPPPPTPRPRVTGSSTALATQNSEQRARQTLRQEQESAYEKSLRADREKVRLRKEAEAAQQREEQRARDREQWRRWRASVLKPEPGADVKQVCRFSIRKPDGVRLVRKFAADAPIEEIYAFVETHEVEVGEKSPGIQPEGYVHEYDFRLVQAMPRSVFEASDTNPISATIGKSANLIVEPLDQDEDDDAES